MWIQVLHLSINLLFSNLDFHMILFDSEEYPNYVDITSYVSFLKFLTTFVFAFYLKKFISIKALWTKLKLTPKKIIIIQFMIDIIQIFFALNNIIVLEGRAIFFSRYTILIILMLFANIIISFFSKKCGLYELYFGFFITPCMILWSQSTLFKYCLYRTILNVGPISLQYIALVLIYPQDFKSYGKNDNKLGAGIDKEILNPNFNYPLAKLFGRQDSFRLIFILFNYCCFDLFFDYWKTGNSE